MELTGRIMAEVDAGPPTSIQRLIFAPALITLALTLLRVQGELAHWSKLWFSTAPGGPGPLAAAMELLAPIFGAYFALRLARLGDGPVNGRSAVGHAVLGVIILAFCAYFLMGEESTFDKALGYMLVSLAALIQFNAWPQLARTLTAYAYAARIPVVGVMLLAMLGHWGTHFDNVPPNHLHASFVATFFAFSLLPQLVFWASYTVVSGALLGTICAAFVDRGTPQT